MQKQPPTQPRHHPPQHITPQQPQQQYRTDSQKLNDTASATAKMAGGDPRNRAPLPVPGGHGPFPQSENGGMRPPFDMARSPPNPPASKNTKHVPCKFFRQGTCQAGPACPFLHSTDNTIDSAPCKYFTKGNCKFGAKCALAHILPDGRRVNRPSMGLGGNLNLGGRVHPPPYHAQDSALANSLLSQQQINGHNSRFSYPYASQDDLHLLPPHAQQQLQQQQLQQQQPPQFGQQYDGSIPLIDAGLVSDTGSKYGSPPEEIRLPMSPIGRTALDAPLPASFDSQGISHMARYGPVAASVPSKFGLDFAHSPSLSHRPNATPDVLRSLHDTAFGLDKKPLGLGSSPPVVSAEDNSGFRVMHSQRVPRQRILSASVPRPTILDDWEDNFTMEEDYLPTNLHDDVLTPQERMRRLSRTEHDLSSSSKDPSGLGIGIGVGIGGSTKVGSPLASSPSRFGALFAKQRQRKEEEAQAALAQNGHVGSPLRESVAGSRSSASAIRPIGSLPGSGDISPFVASPRQSSMSMISEQLSSTSLHPSSARAPTSNPRMDRNLSSPVSTSRIDEEQGDLVFSMEEEESNKRTSAIWGANKETPSTEGEKNAKASTAGQDKKDGSGKSYLKMESLYGNRS
ncbi:hypothetical protein MGYG_05636 [Nannizzia gypsea CBS 118893]|uniref:C3H1-type domain-containing protein n=1 Tax=Arthroderma gypseum (strain ATCC MYA-4604 / CBS 118893) TaxID=535722 RepID=E4UX00_ARTGP|nr:hypothetical protein MGYG_05636 [Nannizzia gypsea CBS 118893]EFR02639.1 hypothetical protein MGYG_05636 [Nannizzia gypsea CBS 118893]